MSNLKKWWEIYANDAEKRLFVGADGQSGLCRSKSGFAWRTVGKLVEESKLTRLEVEDILDKYNKMGIVRQHKNDPEKWGYWENIGNAPTQKDVVQDDIKDRVDKAKNTKNAAKP